MRKLIFILGLLLCCAVHASATALYVRSAKNTAGAASPYSATLGGATTAGNVIVACMKSNGQGDSFTVNDGHSGVYTDTGNGGLNDATALITMACMCGVTLATATYTVVVTSLSGNTGNLVIAEFSGATCTHDGFNSTNRGTAGASGQNATAGAIVTGTNGDFIVGWIYNTGGNAVTANTGASWTSMQTIPTSYGNAESIVQTTAGSISPTWHTTAGDAYDALGFALKASVASSSIPRHKGGRWR